MKLIREAKYCIVAKEIGKASTTQQKLGPNVFLSLDLLCVRKVSTEDDC